MKPTLSMYIFLKGYVAGLCAPPRSPETVSRWWVAETTETNPASCSDHSVANCVLSGKRDILYQHQWEPLPTLTDSCDFSRPSRGLTPGRLLSNHQVCLCGLGLLFIFFLFVHTGSLLRALPCVRSQTVRLPPLRGHGREAAGGREGVKHFHQS